MNAKKVGTVSLYGFLNYGNYLQNYAVHSIWKMMGYDPVLLDFKNDNERKSPYLQLKSAVVKVLSYMPTNRKRFRMRYLAIQKFTISTMNVRTIQLDNKEEIKQLSNEYCYFSVGSDQIWNPHYIKNNHYESFCFLSFAKREQKMCMVPSFGVSQIPEESKPLFIDELMGFNSINVREEDGARIVKELTGKYAEVLADPTMALTLEEWSIFAEQSNRYDKKSNYILMFFLGSVSDEYRRTIEDMAKKRGLSIVDMLNPKDEAYTAIPPRFCPPYIQS